MKFGSFIEIIRHLFIKFNFLYSYGKNKRKWVIKRFSVVYISFSPPRSLTKPPSQNPFGTGGPPRATGLRRTQVKQAEYPLTNDRSRDSHRKEFFADLKPSEKIIESQDIKFTAAQLTDLIENKVISKSIFF